MAKKSVTKKVAKSGAKKMAKSKSSPAAGKKKAPAKTKKKVEVTIKRSVLGHAPEEYHFVLQDGKKLKNVYELVDALETMSEDIFRHHVNDVRNDFSNWIEHVFDEKQLAKDIRHVRDRMESQRRLMKKLINEALK